MQQLVIDAGPLIALFYGKDTHHAECIVGFEQLSREKVILLSPIPIVFEVYKWLLQRVGSKVAQSTLDVMEESLHLVALSKVDFQELRAMIRILPSWHGSLEDTTVIFTAHRYHCPVWTLNFRDFGMFKALEFWNPYQN